MSLDIVIPAHNEEQRIERTLLAYRTGFPQPDVRFHVALDGCHDRTADVVRTHSRDDRRVVLHEYPKLGKGGVLMETFRRCDADLVGFVDADCSTPPAELARMTEQAADNDGVIASRRLAASVTPRPRRCRSIADVDVDLPGACARLFRLPYADTQCGAKVVRRDVVSRVVPLMSSRDFLFDVDLLVLARRLGFEFVEVPTVWIDQAGSKVRALGDTVRMLASALRLWIHHRTMPVGPVDPPVRRLPTVGDERYLDVGAA